MNEQIRRNSCLFVGCILYLNSQLPLWAAELSGLSVGRVAGKIQVDGVLNESVWQETPSIRNLVQVEPQPGAQPTEPTRIWVVQGKDALYIAVRCFDSNASRIVATEMSRDAELRENDNIEIVPDTYHDHRNAYYFFTNAVGALVDGRVTEN